MDACNKDSLIVDPNNKDSLIVDPHDKDSLIVDPHNKDSYIMDPHNKDSGWLWLAPAGSGSLRLALEIPMIFSEEQTGKIQPPSRDRPFQENH